jgi:FkbM family methyltransferase
MKKNLIYDVGMHNGADTAYYLHRGYTVLAIEASPILVAQAQRRFAQAIQSGQLTLLHVGIAERARVAPFWINTQFDEWSSFDRAVASRDNTSCDAVDVRCVPFDDVLREHGTPYYLKIDIERSDIWCLRGLQKGNLPQYISIEAHSLEYLSLLYELGYRSFKIVNQAYVWKMPTPTGWRFHPGSSGPFGPDTPGEWAPLEVVAYDWLHGQLGYPQRSSLRDGWYDFHASLAPPSSTALQARPPLRHRMLMRTIQKIEGFYRRFLYRSSF